MKRPPIPLFLLFVASMLVGLVACEDKLAEDVCLGQEPGTACAYSPACGETVVGTCQPTGGTGVLSCS